MDSPRDRRTMTILLALLAAFTMAPASQASAQTLRIELHPIRSVTLTVEQFLTGVKDGPPATIVGELRFTRLGADRLPAVVLMHGSGGVGAIVDRWSQDLGSVGMATFIVDSFTGRGITAIGRRWIRCLPDYSARWRRSF
jgi:hypothetical protein